MARSFQKTDSRSKVSRRLLRPWWTAFLALLLAGGAHGATESESTDGSVANVSTPIAADNTEPLHPYTAQYRLHHNGMSADATRSLQRDASANWTLSQRARVLFVKVSEESQMRETPSGLLPLRYTYENSIASRNNQNIEFNYQQQSVSDREYRRPWSIPLQPEHTDQLSAQLQLRKALLDGRFGERMTQTILTKGKEKTYTLEKLGEETIDTPVGRLATVKLRRYREGRDGEMLVWLAKDWNYLIVRLEERDDGDFFLLELLSAEIDGSIVGA